uniref:Uncharacterized protein n=1 Tax=Rhizophora mucronata TaxID=61149 RepID=A0A2P2QSK9_RHIMU
MKCLISSNKRFLPFLKCLKSSKTRFNYIASQGFLLYSYMLNCKLCKISHILGFNNVINRFREGNIASKMLPALLASGCLGNIRSRLDLHYFIPG